MPKLCTLFAPLLVAVLLPTPATAQQDPVARSKELRYAGNLDAAANVLRPVLARDPKHYLANYNMGLVEEARAQRLTGDEKRFRLLTAAAFMERALAVNAVQNPREYTLFSTLGYVYLQLNDIANADRVLSQGLAFASRLSPTSRSKLYNNLGYLSTLKGDRAAAIRYYDLAKSGGIAGAEANARRLRTVK